MDVLKQLCVKQILTPGVKNAKETDCGAEMFGIGRNGLQRLGGGPEENAEDGPFVLQGDVRDLFRHSKDDMKIRANVIDNIYRVLPHRDTALYIARSMNKRVGLRFARDKQNPGPPFHEAIQTKGMFRLHKSWNETRIAVAHEWSPAERFLVQHCEARAKKALFPSSI